MPERRYSREILAGTGIRQRKAAELEGGAALLARLREAVVLSEPVTVYGDYDADGIMATYILYSGLNRLRPGNVHWFINNRFEDGYNITEESMQKCLARYPDTRVILTCDNGINAREAVGYAMKRGVTVLVTDHHIQTVPLTETCPAIDEKSVRQTEADRIAGMIPEEYCGAELARRVIRDLYGLLGIRQKNEGFLDSLYAFSGFATITDSVPMNGSNHQTARKGLAKIRKQEGFWALLHQEFSDAGRQIHGDTIGFYYGTLINAGSRITGKADPAMNMLLAWDSGREDVCRQAIRELIGCNEKRKELCDHDDAIAFSMIEQNGLYQHPFILVYDERFSEGVNGLTATHITARYHVPSAVLSPVRQEPGVYKGSARSVEGCDLIGLFQSHPDVIRAGGHAMAAGLSVDQKDLEHVRELLDQDMQGFSAPPEPEPDFLYQIPALSMQAVDWHKQLISALEPFGPGFEEPRIEFRGAVRNLWEKNKKNSDEKIHAAFPMGRSADGYLVQANWWKHLAEARRWFQPGKELRCRGKADRNEYTDRYGNQRTTIQITIDHLTE